MDPLLDYLRYIMPNSIKVCTKCGADIWPGETHCSDCGAKTHSGPERLPKPHLTFVKGKVTKVKLNG